MTSLLLLFLFLLPPNCHHVIFQLPPFVRVNGEMNCFATKHCILCHNFITPSSFGLSPPPPSSDDVIYEQPLMNMSLI